MRLFARAVVAFCAALVIPFTAIAFADPQKPAAPASDAEARIPPDPPPLVEKKQWVFDLRWDKGDVYMVGIHPLDLAAAQATPRVMGRFALELYEGPTLLERVRFDFPLLMPPETDGAVDPISAKLKTRIGVLFPATKRGTKIELWDRATHQRWALPWPPPEPDAAAPTDGGKE